MIYHYDDIKPEWADSAAGVLGYDIPLHLASDYTQRITLAAAALGIGYQIGMMEAERMEKEKKQAEAAKN